ncbi:MAG: hypothetical protein M3144_06905, partial [Actinomycetota bacterium]|nr:hypothetical protein [Actinomycetota bacterium]
MPEQPTTTAGRALRSAQWGLLATILAVVGGNIVHGFRQQSLLGIVLMALVVGLFTTLMVYVVHVSNAARERSEHGFALFVATATAEIERLKMAPAWA